MSSNRAYTLVEILMVVVIIGILAAIVVPRMSTAAATAKGNLLADDLRMFRTQVEIFAVQHGIVPGYPDCQPGVPTEEDFILQMTNATNASGQFAPPGTPGYPYGPYFTEIPANPVNGKNTIQVFPDTATIPAVGNDSHGWVYQPGKRIFKSDCSGKDSSGVPYYSY